MTVYLAVIIIIIIIIFLGLIIAAFLRKRLLQL